MDIIIQPFYKFSIKKLLSELDYKQDLTFIVRSVKILCDDFSSHLDN